MIRNKVSAIVTISLIASIAIGSDAPDKYRQAVRDDPLIRSIIGALSTKHGCPWLHERHGNGGMWVMKEVEPFFYSKNSDSYKPTPGKLEVSLACSHAVSATVHTLFNEAEGHQPLVKYLDRIDFSYDNFLLKLGRRKPSSSSPDRFILADPIITELYPVLVAHQGRCNEMADGKISIDPETKFRPGLLGRKGLQLEYQEFEISYACPRENSGVALTFKGGFYTETELVTWETVEVSGWVN